MYIYAYIYIYMYSIDMVLVYIYIHICTNKFIYIYIYTYKFTSKMSWSDYSIFGLEIARDRGHFKHRLLIIKHTTMTQKTHIRNEV